MRTLLSEAQISSRVKELGSAIRDRYLGSPLTMVPVLKGSFVFAADLMRAASPLDMSVDFLGVSSYGDGTSSSGDIRVTLDLSRPIDGCHVLVVEDIIDTGLTLSRIMGLLKSRNPASISLCALLHKPAREQVPVSADFLGFTIDDEFVVGYGLDHGENYRHLPYIGVLS